MVGEQSYENKPKGILCLQNFNTSQHKYLTQQLDEDTQVQLSVLFVPVPRTEGRRRCRLRSRKDATVLQSSHVLYRSHRAFRRKNPRVQRAL